MNKTLKNDIELEAEIEAQNTKFEQEAETMASNNPFVAEWRQDSKGLADLIASLNELATGRAILYAWMTAHPEIDPPLPA
jgi:hypothetical protein